MTNALIQQTPKQFVYSFSFASDRELTPEAQSALNLLLASGIMKELTESEFWNLRNELTEAGVAMNGITRVACQPEDVA